MKHIYIFPFLLFAFIIGQINYSHASHTMGADLTYQCLGGEQYQLTLSFYRDCSGINAPSSVKIDVKSASCGISTSITMQPIAGTGQEITPICPTVKTTCNGGTYTGIEEYVYTGTFTLPVKCDDWIFSFDECCRNAAITTINNPTGEDLYVEAHLDNLNVTCNSSPSFSNKPVPFVCQGNLFCFNHGATDVDGDSLVYSLTDPMTSANTVVNYNAGYSATKPLKSSPALTFDSQTGDFCVTPTQIEVTVMAIKVEEYRNGILIGSVIRDIQVTIDNCNNVNPSVDGINGTGKFDTAVCAGTQICFNINSTDPDANQIVTMSWNNAIGGNASFTTVGSPFPVGTFCWKPKASDASATPQCFTVEVKDDNCPYNGTQTYSFCITVTGLKVDAGKDQSISCVNTTTLTGTASGGSGNYTYLWSNGDATKSTTVSAGAYLLSVDDGAGCIGDDSVTVTYFDAPVADLSFAVGCSNPIAFTDATTISGGPTITSWQWDFGDGNTSTSQNPSNSYALQGTYTVSLIATSSLGCADTASKNITINAIPSVNFSNTTVCLGSTTDFTDLSTLSSGNITSWAWDFGDVSNDNTQNPSHLYASSGFFIVSLTITTDSGCTAQVTNSVEVSTSPTTAFTTNDICLNEIAAFNNTTTISSGTIGGYVWDFGDGGSSAIQTPTHSYAQSGTYTVILVAASSGGCSDTATQNIVVNDNPSANLSVSNACLGLAIPFSDLSTSLNSIIDWQWGYSGSGVTSTEQSPTIIFSNSGTMTAQLIVTDNNGCKDTATAPFSVYDAPLADYSVKDVCLNDVSSFNDLSVIASGSIVSWQWDFGDGNTSTNQNSTNTYSSENTYTTQLIVTSDNGCTDTLQQQTIVNPLPQVTFNPDVFSGCEDLPVNFMDLSTISTGSLVSYAWSFGDGNSSTAISPIYTYADPGTYSVTLTATSDKGCISTSTSTNLITVYPLPISEYLYSPHETSILFPDITFTDASTDAISWAWNFGDGSTSTEQFPSHSYADSGTYIVKLLVVNSYGCLDSVQYDVRIDPDGILYIPNTFTPNNDDVNDGFIAKGFGIINYSMRIFDRWGNELYSCTDITKPWDGKVQSTQQLAPQDIYVYHIDVTWLPKEKHTYIGKVSLLR